MNFSLIPLNRGWRCLLGLVCYMSYIEGDRIVVGNFDDAFPSVKRRLNGFLARYDRIKIGATTDPLTRWRRGYERDGWSKMVILYQSQWAGSTRKMERELISYARGTKFRVQPENILAGGETIKDDMSQYFIYVVVA